MRKAVMILLALLAIRFLPKALRREARALELITLLFSMTAAAAANTSKTASVEIRTGNLETRVGNLEKGQFSNLQGSSLLGQIAAGNFGGQSVSCATLTTTGSITAGTNLGVNGGNVFWPGGVGISTSQASFLSGLRKLDHLSGQPADGNTGSTWATGERGYINNCVNWINNIDGDLQNKGWMN
jgi:hypothetical protein